MKRFVFAWELGSGYGHLAKLRDVSDALRERGHHVAIAMRDLSHANTVLGDRPVTPYQAPLWLPQPQNLPPSVTFPELLLRFGYSLPDRLRPVVAAWRTLLEAERAEGVLAEHAPTAVLAARTLGIPVAMLGTGFTVPPAADPMPVMVPGLGVEAARRESAERVARDGINAVLGHFGCPEIDAVGALFRCRERFLFTFPEIDPYAASREPGERYLGARLLSEMGGDPPWPGSRGPRLFAYLRNGMPHQDALLRALGACGASVVAHVPLAGDDMRRRFENERLVIAPQPVSMARVGETADAAVCLASHGTTVALLLRGVPVLLLPSHVEQLCTALLVRQRGLGAMVDLSGLTAPLDRAPDFAPALAGLLAEPRWREGARAFAARYRQLAKADPMAEVASRLEGMGPRKETT